jgi:lysophospholipase L1-like esterase
MSKAKNGPFRTREANFTVFKVARNGCVVNPPGSSYNSRRMQIRVGRHSLLLLMPLFVSVCSSSPRGFIVFCAGDSITAEAYPHFLQRLFNDSGLRGRVLNHGRSGDTSGEYLDYLEKNAEKLAAEHPDFVLLQLGTNDVRMDADSTPNDVFIAHMKKLVAIFRGFRSRAGKTPQILLATVPPIPSGTDFPFSPESSRRVAEEINPAVRAISAEAGLPVVDNYGLFLANPGLLPGVHPTKDGYRLLAENWFSALKPFLGK